MAVAISCGALQLLAMQPPPPRPLGSLLLPERHARPVAPDTPRTPGIFLDGTGLGTPLRLEKGWRVGITSNPAAASPELDDSAWPLRDGIDSFEEVPDLDHPAGAKDDAEHKPGPHPGGPRDHQRPWVWFRLHVRLAPNHGPLSLLVELPVSHSATIVLGEQALGFDVYADGKLVQPDGPHPDQPQKYQQISRIYNLSLDPSATSVTLALRAPYIPFGYGAYTAFFASHNLRLGHPDELSRSLELWRVHSLFERLPRLVISILLLFLSLFLLALYFTQQGHIEYLWLALYELVWAPFAFIELAGSSAQLDQIWYVATVLELAVLAAYLYFEFLNAFLAMRRRWYILALRLSAPVMLFVGPALLGAAAFRSASLAILLVVAGILTLVWLAAWLVFVFVTLIAATLKRNFEAGLLLIPLVLSLIGAIEPLLSGNMSTWAGREFRSPLTIQAGLIPIHFASVAEFTGLFVIVLIVFVRFLRVQRDQERVSSELAAARSVQELMIPHEKLKTPGFAVDSVYNPAAEVGGDFFHIQSTPEGGLLAVIGDVAGKGLKAAMNVSMLMGALRRTPESSPARILESLNRVLAGSESFTTCQAAWFGPDGELILANAGHLPPYLNSQEVNLPGSLPLGVLDDVHYEEIRLFLHPGDRILMLSDGVAEARRPNGELFGFDRVHNLSNQSAFYIADAARDFGQEDDITVLTIRRLAQATAAA
ncbi:MAG: PP2C family protein-serine/threonine phosphatase [Terracidiphilus sp.]